MYSLSGNNAKPGDKVRYVDDSPTPAFGPGPNIPKDQTFTVVENFPNGYGDRLLKLKEIRHRAAKHGAFYAWRFEIILPPDSKADKEIVFVVKEPNKKIPQKEFA